MELGRSVFLDQLTYILEIVFYVCITQKRVEKHDYSQSSTLLNEKQNACPPGTAFILNFHVTDKQILNPDKV